MLSKLIIFILLIIATATFGQEYTTFTTKDGLPSNYVYHLVQDSKGFIWFATNRGIAKFDGVKFKIFTTKDGLPNNDIWKLTTDESGRVWWNAKSKFQGYIENDSVYKFKVNDGSLSGLIFWKTKANQVTLTNGSQHYKLQRDSFCAQIDLNTLNKMSENFSILAPHTNILIQIKGNEVFFYDSTSKKASKIEIKNLTLEKPNVDYKLQTGYLPNTSIFYTDKYQIFLINTDKNKAVGYSFKNLINKYEISNAPSVIWADGKIQLSIPGYLFILNHEFEIIKEYTFPNYSNNVNSYKDKDGNIWLNDTKEGVVLLPNSINHTAKFLSKRRIQKVHKINNKIIAGEYNTGVHYFEPSQEKFYLNQDIKARNNIYRIKDNEQKGSFSIVTNPSYISTNYSSSILQETIFQETDTEGIITEYSMHFKDIEIKADFIYAVNHNSFLKVNPNSKKTENAINKPGLMALSLFKDNIFAAGDDGLFLYKNNTLVRPNGVSKIPETTVIYSCSDSVFLYLGTDGRGVYLYNGNKEIYLKNTDGLVIQKIIRQQNKLWLSTQEGVKVVKLNLNDLEQSEIIDSYYESDGLLQNNTNDIFLEDSLLWIATDIGLSRINTRSAIFKQITPVMFDFNSDTVTYNYSNNSQTIIGFHGLNYTNQNYLQYEYRLLPSNEEWIKTNTQSINFSGLSPDLYCFEVRVTDQHFNQSTGNQYIKILPGWWQTIWVKLAAVLVVFLFLFLLIKIIQLRIRKIELRKTKLAGLELQALRSQMNPHFVHNSLNAIKYYIQRNEPELSEEYLVKFSKLIRLFFDFSRREKITVKEEIQLLDLYLQIEQLRFEEKLSFNFDIDERLEIAEVFIPSMLLQPLVENAVNHGVFHKKGIGRVNIAINYIAANQFEVIIEDDGIGIKKAKNLYNPSSDNYQSNSSEVIQDRLELLNKSEEWKIAYSINDLSEISNTNGTRVSLLFKQIS